jgi:predicted DCC family thiol-disulfide oxidoreductase YuxK
LQTPGPAERLGVTDLQLLEEMWLQFADGRTFSGVNAWSLLMRRVRWLWPLGFVLSWPGIHAIARSLYRWTAKNRYCLGGWVTKLPPNPDISCSRMKYPPDGPTNPLPKRVCRG